MIVETKVTFATKAEEIKRVMKKSDKERLARALVGIRQFINDPDVILTSETKLRSILKTVEDLYW